VSHPRRAFVFAAMVGSVSLTSKVGSMNQPGCPRSRYWDLGMHDPKVTNHAVRDIESQRLFGYRPLKRGAGRSR
jgi:hypothetical protein